MARITATGGGWTGAIEGEATADGYALALVALRLEQLALYTAKTQGAITAAECDAKIGVLRDLGTKLNTAYRNVIVPGIDWTQE